MWHELLRLVQDAPLISVPKIPMLGFETLWEEVTQSLPVAIAVAAIFQEVISLQQATDLQGTPKSLSRITILHI